MTDISALEVYAGELSEAAAQARAASQVQHDYVNGDSVTDVPTESGPLATLAKQAVQAQDKVGAALIDVALQMAGAMTYTTTAAGLAGTVNDGYFSVPSSDSNEYLVLYQNAAGVAVEKKRYPSTKAVERLDVALDQRPIPGYAFTATDGLGGYPIRVRNDGGVEIDLLTPEAISFLSGESLSAKGIRGVVLALFDAVNGSPWFVRENGASCFAAVETDELLLGGIDIAQKINNAGAAKSKDLVMGSDGLTPMYADMQKVSTWGSSSLEYLTAYLTPMLAELAPSATYFNGSKGGETSRDAAARLGSIPMLVSIPTGSIPASGGVTVTAQNVAPNQFLRPYTGTLNGVYGTISSDGTAFTFTRATDGAVSAVSANTPFAPEVGPTYRDGVAFLWMGKNDMVTTDTFAEIAGRTDTSFNYFLPSVKRILVFGHFGNPDWIGTSYLAKLLQVNALHAKRYGPNYFDVIGYICSAQVWIDTGITPTSADLTAQENGCMAPSLTLDGAHFSAKLNTAFTSVVKAKLISLGWF